MKVALIGSGGREDAIAYRLAKSNKKPQIFILPGNYGTSRWARNIPIQAHEYDKICDFCAKNKIDLVIIGPEQPLVDGLADRLRKIGINVFGPNKRAALIEGDKQFAKEFMKKYNIPTADFVTFSREDYPQALEYLEKCSYPLVIKASGLAAGKGVIICSDIQMAQTTVKSCFIENKFGDAGNNIILEEFLNGVEASVFVLTDGDDYLILPTAQDYKRAEDDDKGPNTGGMGAFSPAIAVTDWVMEKIEKRIIIPTLNALKSDNRKYNGCLYIGLMIEKGEPKVIEYNCRFGDPETQVIIPQIIGHFPKLLYSISIGKIDKKCASFNNTHGICVVAASGGYPGAYEKGFKIHGLDLIDDNVCDVYHAGTRAEFSDVFTNGGRILSIACYGIGYDVTVSSKKVYARLAKIKYKGIYYRKDIAANMTDTKSAWRPR
ncbi:MAG: phosphoribosylamine--glycine ligase [Bacteroidetes bacterium]|nr:phosphoribosylamine--glycine ligase [Bacteroidota bacterium]MBU1677283.1 phosphoribosylamine--glycine ligase [Bacteroidota bacterium]MBU2507890.1 phosphoribosylamine--glycine ligase [Bacteroidota bacterium]